MTLQVPAQAGPLRVRIFVDFWNFSLSLRREDNTFMVDWGPVGPLFTAEAARLVDPSARPIFEAIHVYGSFDPNKQQDVKLKNWFTNKLDRMPGTHVVLVERQKKMGYPKCPQCQTEATECAACKADMRGTEEKGVDTRIVADMISLAWANAYDVAVLVSSDRDFVPVAEFLQTKGIKVVHATFPPKGSHLSQKCWANFNIKDLMPKIQQQVKRPPGT
ncbi:NYN domain-containing protein [Paracoccus yeei]|uniref:NYN domain-containing protein n=1 Tax=Paracoccus yeei TaxID=147645 RepID=UPI0009E0307E|nr:NYN domain-containing protein [Paracoccus yeei]OWJ90412.1 NYN domain-containing protein [Paracoccus yeei]